MIIKIICPNCKGNGKVFDHEAGFYPFGLSYIFQFINNDLKKDCSICNGDGMIAVETIY